MVQIGFWDCSLSETQAGLGDSRRSRMKDRWWKLGETNVCDILIAADNSTYETKQ